MVNNMSSLELGLQPGAMLYLLMLVWRWLRLGMVLGMCGFGLCLRGRLSSYMSAW